MTRTLPSASQWGFMITACARTGDLRLPPSLAPHTRRPISSGTSGTTGLPFQPWRQLKLQTYTGRNSRAATGWPSMTTLLSGTNWRLKPQWVTPSSSCGQTSADSRDYGSAWWASSPRRTAAPASSIITRGAGLTQRYYESPPKKRCNSVAPCRASCITSYWQTLTLAWY